MPVRSLPLRSRVGAGAPGRRLALRRLRDAGGRGGKPGMAGDTCSDRAKTKPIRQVARCERKALPQIGPRRISKTNSRLTTWQGFRNEPNPAGGELQAQSVGGWRTTVARTARSFRPSSACGERRASARLFAAADRPYERFGLVVASCRSENSWATSKGFRTGDREGNEGARADAAARKGTRIQHNRYRP
jgi:hypothetical protein